MLLPLPTGTAVADMLESVALEAEKIAVLLMRVVELTEMSLYVLSSTVGFVDEAVIVVDAIAPSSVLFVSFWIFPIKLIGTY